MAKKKTNPLVDQLKEERSSYGMMNDIVRGKGKPKKKVPYGMMNDIVRGKKGR